MTRCKNNANLAAKNLLDTGFSIWPFGFGVMVGITMGDMGFIGTTSFAPDLSTMMKTVQRRSPGVVLLSSFCRPCFVAQPSPFCWVLLPSVCGLAEEIQGLTIAEQGAVPDYSDFLGEVVERWFSFPRDERVPQALPRYDSVGNQRDERAPTTYIIGAEAFARENLRPLSQQRSTPRDGWYT